MRARIRRIDLTRSPVTYELWPSVDWLAPPAPPVAPRGRGGLWDAMANAVAIAVEQSTGAAHDNEDAEDAEVIELARQAPHLAYLARVAASQSPADEFDDTFNDAFEAEIIALRTVDARDRS
jgi:hypothetical protein